jgi:sialate O-acetylesterase
MKLIISKIYLSLCLLPLTSMADIKPAQIFMDHMVIQRESLAPVWGSADPGEKVHLSTSWGESIETAADQDGEWKLKIKTPEAGGPHTITLQGKNKLILKDVLAGDVWLCTGQSNMGWPISKSKNAKEEISRANYPQIRSFKLVRNPSLTKTQDFGGQWQICSPTTAGEFSATAYFTGRELHKELDVPIGLLTSCWGGTSVEAWTPLEEQNNDVLAQARKTELDNKAKDYSSEQAKANYAKKLVIWEENRNKTKIKRKRSPRKPTLQTDPRLDQNYPGNLFNGMLYPLAPFSIKGVMWYQGEQNSKNLSSAFQYRFQLTNMIKSWQKLWGQNFPFYSVQLPNFKTPQLEPVEHNNIWPVIRESYLYATQAAPNSYTVTIIDLGEAKDIHPKNKQGVGARLASTILNHSYGRETPTTPFVHSFEMVDNKFIIKFKFSGTGLVAKNDKLNGFAIAGEDQKFVWADAKIIQNEKQFSIVVSSSKIKNPVAVRYAWADNPIQSNLYSKEGFPATPFRTDNWELAKKKNKLKP